jgi:hypothetical protein
MFKNKFANQHNIYMLINTFSMQHHIITTLESYSVINFTIEKLNFSKLLINLVFFGYTTGILYRF